MYSRTFIVEIDAEFILSIYASWHNTCEWSSYKDIIVKVDLNMYAVKYTIAYLLEKFGILLSILQIVKCG